MKPASVVGIFTAILFWHGALHAAPSTAPQPLWSALNKEQKAVLQPLEQEWDRLPDYQRQTLLATAQRFPTLSPEQQK
ncbi:MAG TPA: DUF3106 domain-containing protein, partial [Burkholderiales bacterium]|nr:DUF3106 domain-containing protein [Burkholderiales bacterium]